MPTNAATLVSMGLSGYTLHLANRIAHSGSHGQTGAVYAGGAPGLILLSKTAEVFCWVLQRKKRKYDSFPACLDAAIPFHEQTAFWHRHYSCTAPRAVETPLTDVRTFYLPLPWLWPEDVREGEAESLLDIDARTVRRCPKATRSRRNAQLRCWFPRCISEPRGLPSLRRSAGERFHAPCCADSFICALRRSVVLSNAVSCRS